MTTTSPSQAATRSPASSPHRTSAVAGIVSYILGAVFTVPNAHDTGEIVVVLGGAAVVAAVVFGWVVPRGMAKGAPGTALTFSVLAALLLLPAFWSMLPLLLGVGGVMIAASCIEHAPKRSWSAIVLGALTVAGYLYLYVVLATIMGDL